MKGQQRSFENANVFLNEIRCEIRVKFANFDKPVFFIQNKALIKTVSGYEIRRLLPKMISPLWLSVLEEPTFLE